MKAFRPRSGAHILYNLALGSAVAVLSPLWLPWAMLSRKRRVNFPDRLGLRMDRLPPPSGRERIWIHAVSVGETLSAAPLVRRLKARMPDVEILFSTVTVTGQEAARKTLGTETDAIFHFPFDMPSVAGKFLDRLRPGAVVILETEIWPNFLAECLDRGIPAMIVNGRISERSFRGYARFKFLFSGVLAGLAAITAQTEEDARRFLALGAPAGAVKVTGNMKFDVSPGRDDRSDLRERMAAEKGAGARWFVAGSTHEGEEEAVLGAFAAARELDGSVKLLLAPRHPERFAAVGLLCGTMGWEAARWTDMAPGSGETFPAVTLLDTVGELAAAYASADIAFVGGSLVPKGGHNVLEPALYGVPAIVGPHMDNFREIADIFTDARAIVRVGDPAELASVLARWAADPSAESETGRRGRELLDAFRGAADRNADIVAGGLAAGKPGRSG